MDPMQNETESLHRTLGGEEEGGVKPGGGLEEGGGARLV